MKIAFRLTVILCILAIVFTVMPGSMSADSIITFQKTATGYTVAEQVTSARDVSTLNSSNNETIANLDRNLGGAIRTLYEICPGTDYNVQGALAIPDTCNSMFAKNRNIASGVHGGTDLGCNKGSTNAVWTVALFDGEVVYADYSSSYGWHVIQTVDGVPGFYVLYAHLGRGRGAYKSKGVWHLSGDPPTFQGPASEWTADPKNSLRKVGPSSLQVQAGDTIKAGTRLGFYGTTGSSSGLHSHIEFRMYFDADMQPAVQTGHPGDNCYRADANDYIRLGMQLSELEWVYYYWGSDGKGHINRDKTLTPADMAGLTSFPATDHDDLGGDSDGQAP